MSLPHSTRRVYGSYRFWLGIGISAIFLALAIRQVEWVRVITTLVSADLRLIGLGMGLLAATYIIFAVRWRVLLSSSALIPVRDTFSYIMIGYLANTVLPLRLGDVARAVLMGKRRNLSGTLVFGSVMLERVLDVLTVLMLALGLSFIMDITPVVKSSMMIFAGGALVALMVLFVLARNEDRLPGLIAGLPAYIPRAPAERFIRLVARFAGGLRTLRNGRQLGLALLLSGLAWGVAGMATICYVAAFHLPVPWYAGLFVLAVINLGAAIPSSPGAIGVYHYLAVLALSVWVTDKSAAMGYAIGTHGVSILLVILIGGLCLAREGLTFRSMTTMRKATDQQLTGLSDSEHR